MYLFCFFLSLIPKKYITSLSYSSPSSAPPSSAPPSYPSSIEKRIDAILEQRSKKYPRVNYTEIDGSTEILDPSYNEEQQQQQQQQQQLNQIHFSFIQLGILTYLLENYSVHEKMNKINENEFWISRTLRQKLGIHLDAGGLYNDFDDIF
jgi:hypothetical protein